MSNSIDVKTTKPKHDARELPVFQCVCGAKVELNVNGPRKLAWNCANCFREWQTSRPAEAPAAKPALALVR